MAKLDQIDSTFIARLAAAAQRARLVLRRPRQERFDAVRQYVGRHYSEEGAIQAVPCNIIGQYVSVVGRKLIAQNPRVLLSTWDRGSRPVVNAMGLWVNREIPRIRLANTLKRVVTDALFSIGIAKVGLANPAESAATNWKNTAGQPFVERVDLDDFVFDIHCRDLSEAGFIGHRYRAPLRVVRETKMFSKDRKGLEGSYDRIYNMEGDERIGLIGRTTLGSDQEEFEDFVDLWEFYVPRERLIITLRDDNLTGAASGDDRHYGKALSIRPWIGPDCGPYHILGFGTVPGNPMPKAPVMDLIDLHENINRILRKLMRQAERQKENTFVTGPANEDGSRVMQSNDGEIIKVDNPDQIRLVSMGGPNPQNFQFFMAMKELVSWLAGNLDIMGGLSPQSKTAHQDEMLNENSAASIADMQGRVLDFTNDVCDALCWFYHHDPHRVTRAEFEVPGVQGVSIPLETFPNNPDVHQNMPGRMVRSHKYEDMDVKVDAYSLQHQTPQQRLAAMNQVIQQVYLPLAQLAQQQGIALDLNQYFQKVGLYLDDPDIQELLTVGEPPVQKDQGQAGVEKPPMQAETTRNYNRRSLSDSTANQSHERVQAMIGATPKQNGQPAGAGIG